MLSKGLCNSLKGRGGFINIYECVVKNMCQLKKIFLIHMEFV